MSSGNMNSLRGQNKNPVERRRPPVSFIRNRENNRESLKTCGILLIQTMISITKQEINKLSTYVDEMLHSIFFLGYIHEQRLTPEDFFRVPALHNIARELFPEAFMKYSSHLPNRTPFSILLDIMEKLYSTEERIKKGLQQLLKEMKFPNPLHKQGNKNEEYYTLESTVICVCSDLNSQKYYGASLCCRKGSAKKILIDLSCLKTWHEYVSHAVMSFYPGASDDADGITFPESLKCQAFYRDWNENVYKKKRPCSNCKQLFNLRDADQDKVEHPFGNCAETECLSKLLINNQYMQEKASITNHTEEKLERLRSSTRARLNEYLQEVGFNVTDNNLHFYQPSQMQNVQEE